jgi:1-acyl-sn-glycerol-3-phosphate acyltransferase
MGVKTVNFSDMALRTFTLWFVGLPVTAMLFLLVLATLPFDRSGAAIHSIASFWCAIILKLAGVEVEVRGLHNVPSKGPVVFASNHQGIFDIPVLQAMIPIGFRWVAKESLFKIPVIGWTMGFAGYIAINRESATRAFKSMEAAAEKIRSGTSVLVFPEGTRSKEAGVLPFKRGVFALATKSMAPLVPISIDGTRHIMKGTSPIIRPARVRVCVGKPIETDGVDEKALMDAAREAIIGGLGQLERDGK